MALGPAGLLRVEALPVYFTGVPIHAAPAKCRGEQMQNLVTARRSPDEGMVLEGDQRLDPADRPLPSGKDPRTSFGAYQAHQPPA
jgi:hypothetical protein